MQPVDLCGFILAGFKGGSMMVHAHVTDTISFWQKELLLGFDLSLYIACGVAHQALEGIEPKGEDILVQGGVSL